MAGGAEAVERDSNLKLEELEEAADNEETERKQSSKATVLMPPRCVHRRLPPWRRTRGTARTFGAAGDPRPAAPDEVPPMGPEKEGERKEKGLLPKWMNVWPRRMPRRC